MASSDLPDILCCVTKTLPVDLIQPAALTEPALREQLLDIWVAVTNAGGPVGFVAPADPVQIGATLDAALERVRRGADSLAVLRDPAGAPIGMGFLVDRGTPLCRHWRTVLRLMVHPDHQGGGAGAALLHELHEIARGLGLEQLQLTVRDGFGLERFYARAGYEVVGRHPAAVRVALGDDRDEIMLVKHL